MSSAERKEPPPKGSPKALTRGGKLGQGDTIMRQQEIVLLHDVEHLTFAEIAARVGLGEKETRLAYHRYLREVAPLLNTVASSDKLAEYLRVLEELAQSLRRIAQAADNDSAQVGALRELRMVVTTDIELRQKVGLLPSAPRSIADEQDKAAMAQKIVQLLLEYELPEEALERLERILAGEEEE